MYTTALRPSGSDLSFFSKPKGKASGKTVTTTTTTTSISVTRTTRVVPVPRPALKVTARGATPSSSKSATPIPEPFVTRKRPATDIPPMKVKKPRVDASLKVDSLASSRAPSLRPSRQSSVARSPQPMPSVDSRSRSTSVFNVASAPTPRECWEEGDGRPGEGFVSSEDVVSSLMDKYKAHFRDPNDATNKSYEPHPTDYPVTELEYPNTKAAERFILLAPKNPEHYNPIMELESTLHTIVENYLTPAQRALFGPPPSALLTDDSDEDAARTPSPIPSKSSSSPLDSTSSSSSLALALIYETLPILPSITSLNEYARPNARGGPPQVHYLRILRRAIRTQDGPLCMKVMAGINTLLRLLKYPPVPRNDLFADPPTGQLRAAIHTWTESGIPTEVVHRIMRETYQRAVGPNIDILKNYSPFSNAVYGELEPPLTSEIVGLTGLNVGKDALFVDLGSGVGNVVLQASLQTGCRAFGIEFMAGPAELARRQLAQLKIRARMWGVRMGEVELLEGDMRDSPRVDEVVKQADVVLVNNKAFEAELNEHLKSQFLDLKEGAFVVSLRPFVTSTRLSERNLDAISSIFQLSERHYAAGYVSWAPQGGSYFLHRVDRAGYADMVDQLERSRSSSRNVRSRR